MVNERLSNSVVKTAEHMQRKQDRGLDYKKARVDVLGENPTLEEAKEVDALGLKNNLIDAAKEVLENKELEEGSAGCDIETIGSEKINENGNTNGVLKICNVVGVGGFGSIKIDALAIVDLGEKSHTEKPIVITLKIVPQGYRKEGFYTKADIIMEAPNIKLRDRDDQSEEYWKSIDNIIEKILIIANQRNKRFNKKSKRRKIISAKK